MENKCPHCSSTDWDYEGKINSEYYDDDADDLWLCFCNNCQREFKRLETFRLINAENFIQEEDYFSSFLLRGPVKVLTVSPWYGDLPLMSTFLLFLPA